MSAVPSQIPQSLKVNEGYVAGRLDGVRAFGTKDGRRFSHLIKIPAADAYSSPGTVEVTAKTKLGEIGCDLRVKVQISGFSRIWKQRDEDTGEVRNVPVADVRLVAAE